MLRKVRDYFRYFPVADEATVWGVQVTAAGYTEIVPGAEYPPARHPSDHDLNWATGRRLAALQIVMIVKGAGTFESAETGSRRLFGGSAFLVVPQVWHRYRPDPETGWTESWVELRGPLIERLLGEGVIEAARAVRARTTDSALQESLEAIHAMARTAGAGFDPCLSARGIGALATWAAGGPVPAPAGGLTQKIIQAEQFLAEHHAEAVNVEELAERLGVAYSHFRRAFRRHTGYAPWSYVIHLRLARAKRLLRTGDAKLDEISRTLGFNSPFHFSAAFKQAFNQSPSAWRKTSANPRVG